MEKFAIGVAVGALVGVALATNSRKTRRLVEKSQEEIKTKLDDVIDKKLEELDGGDEDEEEDYSNEQSTKRFKKKQETL